MLETISLRYIFLKGEDFYFRKRIPLVLMEDTLPPGPTKFRREWAWRGLR